MADRIFGSSEKTNDESGKQPSASGSGRGPRSDSIQQWVVVGIAVSVALGLVLSLVILVDLVQRFGKSEGLLGETIGTALGSFSPFLGAVALCGAATGGLLGMALGSRRK